VKNFFNLMIYGGGFSTWKKDLAEDKPKKCKKAKKIQNENIMHDFAISYKAQCDDIAKRIYSKNPSLVKKLRKEGDTPYDLKGRVTSYWFQAIENHIIHICYQFLVEKGIIKEKRCGLEYDGICIPPTDIEIDKSKLIADINSIIYLKTGLPIKMKFKDYDEKYILTDIIEKRKVLVDTETLEYRSKEQEKEEKINKLENEKKKREEDRLMEKSRKDEVKANEKKSRDEKNAQDKIIRDERNSIQQKQNLDDKAIEKKQKDEEKSIERRQKEEEKSMEKKQKDEERATDKKQKDEDKAIEKKNNAGNEGIREEAKRRTNRTTEKRKNRKNSQR
jgi:hypothetical protein